MTKLNMYFYYSKIQVRYEKFKNIIRKPFLPAIKKA
jgi:hypothetical protein